MIGWESSVVFSISQISTESSNGYSVTGSCQCIPFSSIVIESCLTNVGQDGILPRRLVTAAVSAKRTLDYRNSFTGIVNAAVFTTPFR